VASGAPQQQGYLPPPPPSYDPFAAAPGKKGKKGKEVDAATAPAALAAALEEELTAEDAEERAMMAMMGIPTGFDSSKGKESEDPNCKVSAVHKKSKRTARQYMNRRGGFNRPLPAERTNEKVNDF